MSIIVCVKRGGNKIEGEVRWDSNRGINGKRGF